MSQGAPNENEIRALLESAQKPAALAMKSHAYYRGKLTTQLKCPVRGMEDFSIWYSPGVAAPCQAIAASPEKAYELTNIGNTIAVISDGSRVLGLGDIGPQASLPVMEGKSLLFKYLGGVDAIPLVLDARDPDDFIQTVLNLQPGFSGVNLEDIAQPKCFEILSRLREAAYIPIWHDDQQGTATVTLAGLMNALAVVGKDKTQIRLALIGAGAAGVAIARLLFAWGIDPTKTIVVDEGGTLGQHRQDIPSFSPAWDLSRSTNPAKVDGGIPEAMADADVVIAYSAPGPGVIKPEWIKSMAADPIVFACANPVPEIWPWEAKAAGAAVVATGRSDFPNQVNNSLCFPAIFRGALDVRASTITDEMCFAAAGALADWGKADLDADRILPLMTEMAIYPLQAAAVGVQAQKQGLAQVQRSYEQLLDRAEVLIGAAQAATDVLMDAGCIPPFPED
ncbi:MAG: NADP-dependent malic enzyme [Chloroflexi bacterium]|nr:NADP-dependent malic enzyme [Chloroflexota bacterium]